MRFKIGDTEVYISFSFFAVFLLMIARGSFRLYIITFLFSLVHEIIHLLFLFAFRISVKRISFSIFGGNITRADNSDSYIKEAIVNLSAPIVNALIGVALIALNLHKDIAYINLILGLFNLLPFYNFDGGRGLENLLLIKFNEASSHSLLFITSLLSIFAFLIVNLTIIHAGSFNYILIVINIYMITCFIVNIFKKGVIKA